MFYIAEYPLTSIYIDISLSVFVKIEKQWYGNWRGNIMIRLARDVNLADYMVNVLADPQAPWASYQIRKIAGCACAGNAGNVFPRRRFQMKPLVSDPGMHHGTCVTHVPWCMSGSLTCGDGENVPGIPGACAPAILRIWQEAHYEPKYLPELDQTSAIIILYAGTVCAMKCAHGLCLYPLVLVNLSSREIYMSCTIPLWLPHWYWLEK